MYNHLSINIRVLLSLSCHDMHVAALKTSVGPSIQTALLRLEVEKLVVRSVVKAPVGGRPRSVYTLTDAGRAHVAEFRQEMLELLGITLVEAPPGPARV